MNKKFFASILTALTIMLPAGAFAATADVPAEKPSKAHYQLDISKLNEKQKADLQTQMLKMMDLRKETVQKMVNNGAMTADQGKAAIQKIDERIKDIKAGNLKFGPGSKKNGKGKGPCDGKHNSDKN